VGAPVATNAFEVHRRREASTGHIYDIAGLVGTLEDTEALPAELEHLGHEVGSVEATLRVERGQDLFFCADLDPFACAQIDCF
jgi:hypothetical protein